MFTDEEMLQITNAINAGLKEFRWELTDFKSEVYKRFDAVDRRFESMEEKFEDRIEALDKKFEARMDAMDKKFEARFAASEEENKARFEAIDKRFEAMDKKIDDRFDSLSEQIMENRLILGEVLKTVNDSHRKYQKSAESVEWCDMQIRILGNVVSEHSEKIARVEEKIAEYEAGKKQGGDGVPSGKGKKRG